MRVFERDDWKVEVDPATWAEIIRFLTVNGWEPGVPIFQLLATEYTVSDDVAASLHAAGEIVLEETLKDPINAHAAIRFDMGKFAEIVTFAEEGEFVIRKRE